MRISKAPDNRRVAVIIVFNFKVVVQYLESQFFPNEIVQKQHGEPCHAVKMHRVLSFKNSYGKY